jgi:hypothetical protein
MGYCQLYAGSEISDMVDFTSLIEKNEVSWIDLVVGRYQGGRCQGCMMGYQRSGRKTFRCFAPGYTQIRSRSCAAA